MRADVGVPEHSANNLFHALDVPLLSDALKAVLGVFKFIQNEG